MTNKELRAKVKEMREAGNRLDPNTKSELFYQLMCKVLDEAVVDYVDETPIGIKKAMPGYLFSKTVIMKDLMGQRLVAHTNGMSITVAINLRNNESAIKKNIQSRDKDFDVVKVNTYGKPEFR
jgi:hypothetical protein